MVVVWPHSGAIQPRPSGTGAAAGWWWYGHVLELSHPDHQVPWYSRTATLPCQCCKWGIWVLSLSILKCAYK